jgi:hypothetical protein
MITQKIDMATLNWVSRLVTGNTGDVAMDKRQSASYWNTDFAIWVLVVSL